jgi:hypothetical protein
MAVQNPSGTVRVQAAEERGVPVLSASKGSG